MAADLTQAERAYFVRKVGGAVPSERLNNIKRRYMSGVIGAGVSTRTPLNQLEKLWLVKVIGGAALNFNSDGELWRQAVMAIGQVPVREMNGNKLKFYLNAP